MTYKTKAIVLKSKDWPRGARLYTLYTERFGKIYGVAAGVQKIKSKVAGHLQPFTIVEVMMAKGRKFDRLAQSRYVRGYHSFSQDFQSYIRGSYVLELIDRLTDEGIADYQVWQLLEQLFEEMHEQSLWALNAFGEEMKKTDLLIRYFALKILDLYGVRPELYACLNCKHSIQEGEVYFSLSQSGVYCHSCSRDRPEARQVNTDFIKLIRAVLQGNLQQASRITCPEDLEEFTKEMIDYLVLMQTQRPLSTLNYLQPGKEWSHSI